MLKSEPFLKASAAMRWNIFVAFCKNYAPELTGFKNGSSKVSGT
jgi:hypothetical protein